MCYLRMRQDNALLHAARMARAEQSLCARFRSPKMPCIRLSSIAHAQFAEGFHFSAFHCNS